MREYKNGDKVVIRKDLEVGKWYGKLKWTESKDYLKEKDYVVIKRVDSDGDHVIESGLCITVEMIQGLYEEDKSYIWYLDSEDGTYFLCFDGAIYKIGSPTNEEFKKGKHAGYLLTEEEARKSPFFDKFKKHDPFEEKLYYILVKGQDWEDRQFLNLEVESSRYFFDNDVETDGFKITFTEKEANEIIGTSSILYKEEC